MQSRKWELAYETYQSAADLPEEWRQLLLQALTSAGNAYAPYSRFCVGAAALLKNGQIVTGSNQENAAYPVGICAERVLLAQAATLHPGIGVSAMAVSYVDAGGNSNRPISPCGMCRQYLVEYEARTNHPITLILGGKEGEVYVIHQAASLLPLAFGSDDLSL